MQKDRENPQPLGICQRLFNLIMNGLFAKGPMRVTSGHPAPPEKTDSTGNSKTPEFSEGSGSGIHVRFKQTEDSEYWDFLNVEKDDSDETKTVMDSAAEASKKKNRRKVSIGTQEPRPKGHRHKHLFSVDPNINEKTEAFIRHRKEAMTKAS